MVQDFFEVDLARVKAPELDPSWLESKGYSRQDMERWMNELREVQRLMREQGLRDADFARMRTSAHPGERRLGETFHKLYDHASSGPETNQSFIKLTWQGDHYVVENGHHRVWLAQNQGLTHMPAQVSAADQATLDRLRAESERGSRIQPPPPQREVPLWERRPSERPERHQRRERT